MKVSKLVPRSALAAVAAVALAAPVAGAVPVYDGHPPGAATAEAYDVNRETGAYTPANASADMHASTVEPAFETSVTGGDLRTEATKAPSGSTADTGDGVSGDLRTEAAKPPVAAPDAVTATGDGDDPVDWPLVGLLIAGTLALAGGTAFVVGRRPAGHAH